MSDKKKKKAHCYICKNETYDWDFNKTGSFLNICTSCSDTFKKTKAPWYVGANGNAYSYPHDFSLIDRQKKEYLDKIKIENSVLTKETCKKGAKVLCIFEGNKLAYGKIGFIGSKIGPYGTFEVLDEYGNLLGNSTWGQFSSFKLIKEASEEKKVLLDEGEDDRPESDSITYQEDAKLVKAIDEAIKVLTEKGKPAPQTLETDKANQTLVYDGGSGVWSTEDWTKFSQNIHSLLMNNLNTYPPQQEVLKSAPSEGPIAELQKAEDSIVFKIIDENKKDELSKIEYQDYFVPEHHIYGNKEFSRKVAIKIPTRHCNHPINVVKTGNYAGLLAEHCEHYNGYESAAENYLKEFGQEVWVPKSSIWNTGYEKAILPKCCPEESCSGELKVTSTGSISMPGSLAIPSCSHLKSLAATWEQVKTIRLDAPSTIKKISKDDTKMMKEFKIPRIFLDRSLSKEERTKIIDNLSLDQLRINSATIQVPETCCGKKNTAHIDSGLSVYSSQGSCQEHQDGWENVAKQYFAEQAQGVWLPDPNQAPLKRKKIYIPKNCAECGHSIKVNDYGDAGYTAKFSGGNCQHYLHKTAWTELAAQRVDSEYKVQNMNINPPLVPLTTKNESLAEHVFEQIKEHAYPYGKYFRKQLAGESHNKTVDLYWPNKASLYKNSSIIDPKKFFIDLLKLNTGYHVYDNGDTKYRNAYGDDMIGTNITVIDSAGAEINVNFHRNLSGLHGGASVGDSPIVSSDIDSIHRTQDGKYASLHGYSLEAIKKVIESKTFRLTGDALGKEVNELLAAGYLPASVQREHLSYTKTAEMIKNLTETTNRLERSVADVSSNNNRLEKSSLNVDGAAINVKSNLQSAMDKIEELAKILKQQENNQIMKDSVPLDKVGIGDRIVLGLKDSDGTINHIDAYVVAQNDADLGTIFYLDEPWESSDGNWTSWAGEDINNVIINKNLQKLNLSLTENNCWNLNLDEPDEVATHIVKIISKANKKGKKNMSYDEDGEEVGFWDQAKAEVAEGMLEVAATQATDALQGAILAIFKDKAAFNDGELAVVKKMLASKFGHALMSQGIGQAIDKINFPGVTDHEGVQELGKKFRVGSYREVGNEVADLLKEYILPIVMQLASSLPEMAKHASSAVTSKKRVIAPTTTRVNPSLEIHPEEDGQEQDVDVSDFASASASSG